MFRSQIRALEFCANECKPVTIKDTFDKVHTVNAAAIEQALSEFDSIKAILLHPTTGSVALTTGAGVQGGFDYATVKSDIDNARNSLQEAVKTTAGAQKEDRDMTGLIQNVQLRKALAFLLVLLAKFRSRPVNEQSGWHEIMLIRVRAFRYSTSNFANMLKQACDKLPLKQTQPPYQELTHRAHTIYGQRRTRHATTQI